MVTTIFFLAAGMVQQAWYPFEPQGKTFRVELPSKPSSTASRTANSAVGQVQLTTAQTSTPDATYSIRVSEHGPKIDPNTLDDGIQQFAALNHATLGTVAPIMVGENPGREVELTEPSDRGPKRSKMWWVVSGSSLIRLTVAGKPGAPLPADADRFLASLEIGGVKAAARGPGKAEEPVAARTEPAAPAPGGGRSNDPGQATRDRAKADAAGAPPARTETADGVEVTVEGDKPDEPSKPESNSPASAPTRKSTGPAKLVISRIPRSAKPYPQQDLEDLTRSFAEKERDGFRDVGPAGSVLVGVRVSYIERFGGPKISSAQPIYRSGKSHYLGRIYGIVASPVTTAFAKPGYAVGGLITHTGLTVDGFRMVYMKVDGDRLDPNDTYNSPWLGDLQGGGPGEVMTRGGLVVGLQGRAGNEVNALGLTALR